MRVGDDPTLSGALTVAAPTRRWPCSAFIGIGDARDVVDSATCRRFRRFPAFLRKT
jgi:hypothetical protein